MKIISYEELLGLVYDILKLDPRKYFVSMKYVFDAKIPTTPIQLPEDGVLKIFISFDCSNGFFFIVYHNRIENENNGYKLICNSYFEYHISFEIEKEFDIT